MSSITDLKIRTLRYRTEAIGKHLQGKHDQKSHGRGGTSEGGGSGDGGGEMLSSSGGGQSNFEMALAASGITSALNPDSYWFEHVMAHEPTYNDILFVMLGSADALGAWPPTWVPYSQDWYRSNLSSMIGCFPGPVMLLAPPPVLMWEPFTSHYETLTNALVGYGDVCRDLRLQAPSVSFVADPFRFISTDDPDPATSPDFADAVHMSPLGELKVACTVIQSLLALGY